ncbi:MAG: hypothetical protein AB1762_23105, partial [Gemmatimonadota bacterium]
MAAATPHPATPILHPTPIGWRAVVQSLRRPYPVTIPMVALVMLVPVYLVIADFAREHDPATPATVLDAFFPL